jgi:hypothetical protein
MKIPKQIILDVKDGSVAAALESLTDGTSLRVEQVSRVVVVDTVEGTFTFERVGYHDGDVVVDGKMTYYCPGHVIALCLARAKTVTEIREVAKHFKEHPFEYMPNIDGMAESFIIDLTENKKEVTEE